MWLEIEQDTIVGVHNVQGQSDLQWVEYQGNDDPNPGDRFKKGKVIPIRPEHPQSLTALSEEQLAEGRKRWRAQQHIVAVYPDWQQLNILRAGDPQAIQRMGRFIDAVRAWSNDPKSTEPALQKITP